jgi:hypothetical protein
MFSTRNNRKRWLAAYLGACSLLFATIAPVITMAGGLGQWKYEATIYMWAAGMDANTETGGDIDISFNDILDDLDVAFMGSLGARNGKWSVVADTIYLDISQNEGGSETIPIFGPVTTKTTVDTDIDMKASIITFGGGYNLSDDEKWTLDLIVGGRYTWVDVDSELDLKRTGDLLQTSRQAKVSDSENLWDGIVGIRGQFNLNDNWYVPYYADIGAGQSDRTWQVLAGIGYKFRWGDVLLAYRHLEYDFDSGFLLKDLSVSGPALGARFHF